MSKRPERTAPARRHFKEMRFRQLRALVELAAQGSYAGAAGALGVAVPSVWQQVRALEEEFGVQLVAAEGKRVSLTDDGLLLMGLASWTAFRPRLPRKLRRSPTMNAPVPGYLRTRRLPVKRRRPRYPTRAHKATVPRSAAVAGSGTGTISNWVP